MKTCNTYLYVLPTTVHPLLTHSLMAFPISIQQWRKPIVHPSANYSSHHRRRRHRRRFPPPIPTARGSRSAADPILSEHVDRSVRIPYLILPQNVRRFKPDEIDYKSIVLRDDDSVRRLLRSIRELGVFQICGHGILTEDLRSVLGDSDRVFGLTVESCTSYGDHEKLMWRGDDSLVAEEAEAAAAIGYRNYQILLQKLENVGGQLEAMAKTLTSVIAQSGQKQFEEAIQLGEPTLSIYRYHRANIIDRNSSPIHETNQDQSTPYALSLHLLLDSAELCLGANSSFLMKPDTIIVTTGNELQEWGVGELKNGERELKVKPFLKTSRASFSIEQKWSSSKLKMDKLICLWDKVLILLVIGLLYSSFGRIFF